MEPSTVPLFLLAPAWIANMAMSFARVRPFSKPHLPLDFGKTHADGRRLIGETKTWQGVALALVGGTLAGIYFSNPFDGLALGACTAVGDAANAWAKRRRGIASGERFPFFDETNYAIAAGFYGVAVGIVNVETALLFVALSWLFHRPVCWLGKALSIRKDAR